MIFWAWIAYILGICLFFDFWVWRPQEAVSDFFREWRGHISQHRGASVKKAKTSLDGLVNCT